MHDLLFAFVVISFNLANQTTTLDLIYNFCSPCSPCSLVPVFASFRLLFCRSSLITRHWMDDVGRLRLVRVCVST
jgi:hypothetical protein